MKETVLSKLEVERKDIIILFIYELCSCHVQKCMEGGESCSAEETLEGGSEEADLDR